MLDPATGFTTRPLRPTDHALIRETFKESFRKSGNLLGVSDSAYHRLVVDPFLALLVSYPAVFTVVSFIDSPNDIVAWSCSLTLPDPPHALVYAYTKETFRRHGLGTYLFSQAAQGYHELILVHSTAKGARLCMNLSLKTRNSPLLVLALAQSLPKETA